MSDGSSSIIGEKYSSSEVYVLRNFANGKYYRNTGTKEKSTGFSEPEFSKATTYKTLSGAKRTARSGMMESGMILKNYRDYPSQFRNHSPAQMRDHFMPGAIVALQYEKVVEFVDSEPASEIF